MDGEEFDPRLDQPEVALDDLQRLWAPWRSAYVAGHGDPIEGCAFCVLPARPAARDRESLVLHRGEHAFVVLNAYPYNPGHLMVCPYRHVGWYTDATDAERDEMGVLTQQAMRVLTSVSGTQGFNIGMNQGAIGGAGISEHLHQHVVPRWMGDSNFLPIIGATKALPELLDDTWAKVSAAWAKDGDQ